MGTSQTQALSKLEILGVGMSVGNLRQSMVWRSMLAQGDQFVFADIIGKMQNDVDNDPVSEKRAADALEWGVNPFIEKWHIPSLSIWPDIKKENKPSNYFPEHGSYGFFYDFINRHRPPAGMHHHKIASLGAYFKDNPEEVLEHAFRFMEQHPQLPAMLLYAMDGEPTRSLTADMSREKFWERGPRLRGMLTETYIALLLARRERIDAMRPQAGKPAAFAPSTYLPKPWTAEQIAQVDSLPTIAWLHRPQRISYQKDKNGQAVFDAAQASQRMSQREQHAAMQQALAQLLKQGQPARLLYDTGEDNARIVPLSMSMQQLMPDFDVFDAQRGFSISRRLGDTGAASPFVQWALAAVWAWRKQEASISAHLRQKDEASLVFISPSGDKRKHRLGDPIDFDLAPLDGSFAKPVQHIPPLEAEPKPAGAKLPPLTSLDPEATIPPGVLSALPPDWDPDATLPPGFLARP
ncbi:DUF2875 family protein [Massilia sp. W12]|uniref:type VI lipase adapter Tla3 domain-containing protein n=1 Tax=Massilia sp. W12 TaxID=3126507 RepID=UPI0030CD5D34